MRPLDILRPGALARPRAQWSQPNFWDLDAPPVLTTWGMAPDKEPIGSDFEAYVRQAYQACGVVFACITARQLVFSQARFLWREFGENGRPGPLFDSPELELLDRPWQNGTTGELLARLDLDAVVAGNFYATTADDEGHYGKASKGGRNRRIVRMRPDWVTLVIAQPGVPAEQSDPFALDARVVALQFWPRGVSTDMSKAVILLPDEYAHFSPLPDPLARYRGMSWLTPIIREIEADKGATKHKLKFFQHAATPNLSVSLPKEMTPENFHKFIEIMDARHKGASNAWKTLYTTGGADVKVIGADMKNLDFKAVQSYGETRIAAALRVHPVVGFLDAGMQGSALNEGTAKVARRMWADGTIRPLWAMAAASLATLVDTPAGRPKARLWYDDRDIPFLAEDAKDQAEVHQIQMTTLAAGVTVGFEADALVEFIRSGGDLSLLIGAHNGLPSVQQIANEQLPAPEGSPDAA